MSLQDVKLPDTDEFDDVEVIEIVASVGERIEKEAPLLVLESEKASMDIPSPYAGVVKEFLVKVGDKVARSAVICRIEAEGAPAAKAEKPAEVPAKKEEKAAPAPATGASASVKESADEHAQVVILGAGPGGYEAAIRCGQLGLKTILIEKDKVGGVCLNEGCIPSKALIDTSHHAHKVKELAGRGVTVKGEVLLDLVKTQAWKNQLVGDLVGYVTKAVEGAGVTIVHGTGRLTGLHTLDVRGGKEKPRTISFDNLILATGSRAIEVPGLPFDERSVLQARDVLNLDEVPEKFLVVGGGYIGLELGIAFAKFGSAVTIVEMQKQLLPGADPALPRTLARRLKDLGIEVLLESRVEKFAGGKAHVVTKKGAQELPADKILVAVGRRPNTENIGLDIAGIETDQRGFIPTNDKKQTNLAHIYAIGDITHGYALAHKASAEGVVAAEVIAGLPAAFDKLAIPAVVFTDPELAWVGMNEDAAKEAGYTPKSIQVPIRGLGRAMAAGEAEGFVKIIYDEPTGRVLGAIVAGGPATDMIGSIGLGIEMGADIEDIALTIYPHPTFSEQLMIAAQRVAHTAKK